MKMTRTQLKEYFDGKLRIVTNPVTKKSRLVPVDKPFHNDQGKLSTSKRAYYKLRRLSNLKTYRARKRKYMRRKRDEAIAAAQAPQEIPAGYVPRKTKLLPPAEVAARAQTRARRPYGSLKTPEEKAAAKREYSRRYKAKNIQKVRAKMRAYHARRRAEKTGTYQPEQPKNLLQRMADWLLG